MHHENILYVTFFDS